MNDKESLNLPIEQVLPQIIVIQMSTNARRLYACIWNKLNYRGVSTISLSPEIVSKRARLSLSAIREAEDELSQLALLSIRCDGDRTSYTYLDPA
jgi:hypothetical protein